LKKGGPLERKPIWGEGGLNSVCKIGANGFEED